MPPRAPALHPVTRASVTVLPPLPRPRPPELAARKPIDDAKPEHESRMQSRLPRQTRRRNRSRKLK